jgi:hypothetical protein
MAKAVIRDISLQPLRGEAIGDRVPRATAKTCASSALFVMSARNEGEINQHR